MLSCVTYVLIFTESSGESSLNLKHFGGFVNQMLRTVVPAFFAVLVLLGCQNEQSTPTGTDVSAMSLTALQSPLNPPEFPADPSGFVAGITNPYLNFGVGRKFYYKSEDGLESTFVEVLGSTKAILGVATTIVHDQVFLEGDLIEDTYDWYAQDSAGNVWYFGEDSKEMEGGIVVSTEGSWEAGVNDATPGIIMLAEPRIGMRYQQEHAEGIAEDAAQVLSLKKAVEVAYGPFEGVLQTMEYSPLAPGDRAFKYYAPGVGLLLEITPKGGRERVELVNLQ